MRWGTMLLNILAFYRMKMLYMCHSGRPFCTRQVRVFGLVGRTPGFSARITQFRRLREPPGLSKASKPPRMRVDTTFVYSRMRGSAHQNRPIKGGTLASVVSQSLTRVVNNPGPSWDFCPGLLRLVRSPLRRRKLLGSYWSSFSAWGARRSVPDRRRLHQASAVYRFRRNRLS